MKRTLMSLSAAAALFTLAACGSTDEPAATSSTPAASSPAAATGAPTEESAASATDSDDVESSTTDADDTSSSSTEATGSSTTDTEESETQESATGGSDEPDTTAGSTATGLVIPAGAGSALPTTVGDWSQAAGSAGPSAIYDNDGATVVVAFLSGSDFESMSGSITDEVTPVSAGVCGSALSPTNLTCVLQTADGVLSLSADAGDTPLPDLISFADELAAATGAA